MSLILNRQSYYCGKTILLPALLYLLSTTLLFEYHCTCKGAYAVVDYANMTCVQALATRWFIHVELFLLSLGAVHCVINDIM